MTLSIPPKSGSIFFKILIRFLHLFGFAFLLWGSVASAQSGYGVGFNDGIAGSPRTAVFVVSPATGLASIPAVPNAIPYDSSAIGVSPIDGLVYFIERSAASTTPRFGTWDPRTGVAVNIGPTGTVVVDILRATFCPNGRFYIGGSGTGGGAGVEIYEISPATGALIRTLVFSGATTGGSGDIVCTNTGDLYLLTAPAGAGPYGLFRASAAQIATGGTFTPTTVGNLGTVTAPNGLFETPNTLAGCAASPNPCLLASGGALGLMYTINSTTGVATTLTTVSGAYLTDMSREFPRDVSLRKSVTPTVALQSGNTITYSLTVSNAGPAVAANIAVIDLLPQAGVNAAAATWTCTVPTPGQAGTAVPSACLSTSGSGPLNSTVSLSIGGTAVYVISVPLLSSFTGTLTNTATAVVFAATFDSSTANNTVTITSAVTPAANLTVAKTNGVATLVAGGTTSYTITVANLGPANAPGTVLTDPAVPGLSCTSVTCAVTAGTASCPTPLTISALQSTGLSITPTFNANSTLSFVVNCGVTATGL